MISIFNLFSIGIGPSSSHTVGPMKAAYQFVNQIELAKTASLKIELFGSLAFTGKGHGTDAAILLGLEGALPTTVDPDIIQTRLQEIIQTQAINLNQKKIIAFDFLADFKFNLKDVLPFHTNGMRFTAYDKNKQELNSAIYYSIGGGFIVTEEELSHPQPTLEQAIPYPFASTKELLNHCENNQLMLHEVILANESCFHTPAEINSRLTHIAQIMRACIEKGCHANGVLPGGLNIKRRAPGIYQKLLQKGRPETHELTDSMTWLNLYAIAVNEENAAGGRVVTAPTNGAAGVIPAVLNYYMDFYPAAKPQDSINFLLTAGAIAVLYKKRASISGAEVGCQGEVGVASSMAAAALTAVLGGTIYQVENAAEIAMEHHLGMTCDPMGGLVQIPCIERNAMGAVKAVNAARLALLGDGQHFVSLDKVIATMKQTGKDMMTIYKETSLGGLAANIPEC